MITDQDRSGWFGASDTSYIMGNWKTKSFKRWWIQKLGLNNDHIVTKAMNAGTYYEHAILEHIGAERKDHQIIIPLLRLRVNLDGDGPGKLHEIKTHRADKPFHVSKGYWQQVQVEMFAKREEEGITPIAEIVSYGLTENDYKYFFNEIDPDRVKHHPISYDPDFISRYLNRLEYLLGRMMEGVFPDEASN